MDDEPVAQNCYEVLQVHPAAPLELITSAYWWLANREQAARSAGYATEVALHHLTKAYQTLADPALRRSHDASLGLRPLAAFPVVPRRLRERPRRRRGLIARRAADPEPDNVSVDYYEVLRVHPQAEPPILALARAVVGNYYLRLVRFGEASAGLLELLEEAYAAVSDPDGRPKIDAAKEGQGDPGVQPPSQTSPPAVEEASPDRRSTTPPVRRGKKALAQFTEAARGVAETIAARGSGRRNGTGPEEEAAILDRLSRIRETASGQAPAAHGPARPSGTGAEEEEAAILDRLSRVREAASPPAPAAVSSGRAPALARLVVTGGPRTGSEFALNGTPLTLGAAKKCDVVLAGAAARQAWIWASDGQFVVLSLAAEPEMLIGGRPLVQATLQDGDLLTIGPHRIRFDLTG